jgi:NAD+ synthetase
MRFAGVDVTMGSRQVTDSHGTLVGIEICEDLWVPRPPSTDMALRGAEIILNLSASNDLIGKYAYLKRLIEQQSGSLFCAYAYAGAGFGESSTDLIFDGKAMIAECGSMRKTSERFSINGVEAITDVDVEAIRRDRVHTTSWADSCSVSNVRLPLSDDSDEVTDLKFREVDPRPFVPDGPARDERCNDIFNMQSLGLSRRLDAIGCRQAVVGISGGLDSTLALLVTVEAFDRLGLDREGIVGVTMPGFGTTDRTHDNAVKLMEYLGISHREISIVPAVKQHFKDIGHDPSVHDVTYENAQARQRTYLLMDIANACGGIVIGTGDLSELALGWATYNGDHMSMYGVNSGVPKTLVRYLVEWYAVTKASEPVGKVLADVLSTPVSPELLPPDENGDIAQKTEDVVGPYELHDFFLYYTLRYGFSPERIFLLASHAFSPDTYPTSVIKKWMRVFFRRFFAQQFKRSCLPDGPKIGSVCLSPRGDWRMPSDVSAAAWIASLDRM